MSVAGIADVTEREQPATPPSRLRLVLLLIIAVAVAVAAVAGGYYWGSRGGSGTAKPSTLDVGFAQDMATHHQQAVTMASYVRDNSTDSAIKAMAFDIEANQTLEMGEMTGWLDTWGKTQYDAHPMRWMGAQHEQHVVNGLMPGMATPAQMSRLQSLHGKALDVYFLQLMIRHHQGGLPMAQLAERHASEGYVRTLAGHIWAQQTTEIVQMEQMLRQRGSAPLPAPET